MEYNNIQEAQLLRQNIADQITALNEIGFTEIDSSTPLSVIADHMRWAGGLLDLRFAAINKNTGAYADFSAEEWNNLSAYVKATMVKLGIRIRAERLDFIISKDYITRSTGGTAVPWANNTEDIKGLTNYGPGATGHLNDIDGKTNTDLILAYGKINNLTFEAAERVRAYKASTIADDGYDDPTEWSIPAIGQLWLFYKYRAEIDEAFKLFFGTTAHRIIGGWHYSSTEYNSVYAWIVEPGVGYVCNKGYKPNGYLVRAVASVPVGSAT